MQLIYEKSRHGRRAIRLDALDVPEATLPPNSAAKAPPPCPSWRR